MPRDPKHTHQTWRQYYGWAYITASGNGSLEVIGDVTADGSGRNFEAYRNALSAEIHSNAAKLIGLKQAKLLGHHLISTQWSIFY